MYEAFDEFLRHESWDSGDQYDEERFYKALVGVVRKPGFNADEMAAHMFSHFGIGPEDEGPRRKAVLRLRENARAVRNYLRVAFVL